MRGSNSLRANRVLASRLARTGVRAAVVAIAALLVAGPAHAAADNTSQPSRLHRAHQAESSTTSKSPAKPSRTSASHSAAKPAHQTPHSLAQSKPAPRTHHRDPQPQNDPVIMNRAAHSTPRSRAFDARQRLAELRATPGPRVLPAHTQIASTETPQTRISAQPAISAKKTLTTEDFMRAAGESDSAAATASTSAPTESYPRQSQSDHYVRPQRSLPVASAAPANSYTPAPPPQRPQTERIEGFGAEGAVLASSRNTASAPSAPAAVSIPANDPNDPELAALSHQSHEELAESALQPRLNLYSSDGRLIVPAPLVGSHDVLVHQNEMADAEGLSRIEDDSQLASLRARHLLVDFPESASLQVNPDLPDNRRCARPWTVKFAVDMARAYYARFHQPLQINSAVRTVQYQMHLERINGNAAGVDGDSASPHLTGQAIDFAKRGMSLTQIAWMRAYLKPLMDTGKLDVEEEFKQACFHISVYRSYSPASRSPIRNEVAQAGAQ